LPGQSKLAGVQACISSFDALTKYIDENVNFSTSHCDFNEIYEIQATLSTKHISGYDRTLEKDNESDHKVFELLIVKKFEAKMPIIAQGVLKTIEQADRVLISAHDSY
jgi:hypothetical protein